MIINLYIFKKIIKSFIILIFSWSAIFKLILKLILKSSNFLKVLCIYVFFTKQKAFIKIIPSKYKQDDDLGTLFASVWPYENSFSIFSVVILLAIASTRSNSDLIKIPSEANSLILFLSRSTFLLSSEEIAFRPDQFWSKVYFIVPIRSVTRRSSKHQAQIVI